MMRRVPPLEIGVCSETTCDPAIAAGAESRCSNACAEKDTCSSEYSARLIAVKDWPGYVSNSQAGQRLLPIVTRIQSAGGRAFLVGGAVRDGLLGKPVKDLDVEVFGIEIDRLEALLAEFGQVMTVGRSFGVLMLRGLEIDFSLPRRDSKIAPGHSGFEVVFDPGATFEEASRRRDLTINSMGVDLGTGELFDPHGGARDLEQKCLRATDVRHFSEDPLRGLRVAQFAARFRMTASSELLAQCAALDLSELPGERIWGEFQKMLCKGAEPSRGFNFMRDAKLLRFFPEIEALIDVPQDPEWHPEGDVWIHTLMTVDRAAEQRSGERCSDEVLMFSALCHDFGKPSTTEEIDGRIRSRAHDEAGVEPTLVFLERMRARHSLKDQVVALVRHHLAPAQFAEQKAGPRAYRKLARKLGAVDLSMRDLERVARADHLGRTTPEALRRKFAAGDAFLARSEELAVEQVPPIDLVMGRHLIAKGIEPSPRFSEILRRCREIQDDTGWTEAEAILNRALEDLEITELTR
jgi:tRNA nucleotidyltransferase (CCA-adding enzyme)